MKPKIEILAGLPATGKTTRLLEVYRDSLRQALQELRPGSALWLSPTRRACDDIESRLLDDSLPAVFSPQIMTFDGFAERILQAAPQEITPLSTAMQRTLLRRIVAQQFAANRLKHFAGIAHTAGFLDLVTAFISELKRGETWPDDFEGACTAGKMSPRDRELAGIYRQYQELLLSRQLYDSEGRFWSARDTLDRGEWGPFAKPDLVILDGFTDFTFTQYEILLLLAQHAGRVVMSLPLERQERRADLFAKTTGVLLKLQEVAEVTVEWLSRTLSRRASEGSLSGDPSLARRASVGSDARKIQRDDSEQEPPAGLSCIIENLFANPREIALSDDSAGIEVLAIGGQAGEVQFLAARVKQLLLSGVHPQEIVLGLRGLDDYGGLIETLFSEAGIPFACEARESLARTPLLKALVAMLQLEAEDWPFRRLMAVLDSSYFQPAWPAWDNGHGVRDVAAVLRRLSLHDGRQNILHSLEREGARRAAVVQLAQGAGGDGEALDASVSRGTALLQHVSAALAPLRGTHTLRDWVFVLDGLVHDLGMLRGPVLLAGATAERSASADESAWLNLKDILLATSRIEELCGMEPVRLGLADFLPELTDLLQSLKAPLRTVRSGCVRVLDAAQIRNLDVPYLFLAGLTEKSFPQHRGEDCLYNELERQALNRQGLFLGHRTLRTQEEMLLFYGVVTRARRQLILSYPAVGASGQPLSPSPYLTAIQDLFVEHALETHFKEDLDPVPAPDRVLSETDARIRGTFDALERRPEFFRALCERQISAPAAISILAAIDMAADRFHIPGFSKYEGYLTNSQNIAQVAERFGKQHEFSATQLESYAACPLRFFFSHVLKVQPLELPETSTDYGKRGVLVHEVLAELHRHFSDDPGASEGQAIATRFLELLAEKLDRLPESSELHTALVSIEQRLLSEWGGEYGAQWDRYRDGFPPGLAGSFAPSRFEVPFGTPHPKAEAGDSAGPALVFGSGPGEVHVGGRIDRIDVARQGDQILFNIIDYKTGRRQQFSPDDAMEGRALQLVIYALAVKRLQMLGPAAEPYQMGYWHIKEQGFVTGLKSRDKKDKKLEPLEVTLWTALENALEDVIPRLATGIRAGQFPVINRDPHCAAYCAYSTVCRVAQVRALPDAMQKTWTYLGSAPE